MEVNNTVEELNNYNNGNVINNENEETPNFMERLLNYQQRKEELNGEQIANGLKKLYSILRGIFIISSILIWVFVSFKGFLLTCSIYFILMYFNITITSLANAFIGRGENTIIDIIWRILFIILSAIGFGIYFNI